MAERASTRTSATDRIVADLACHAVESLYRLLSDPLLPLSERQLRVIEDTLAPLRRSHPSEAATRSELRAYVLRLSARIQELLDDSDGDVFAPHTGGPHEVSPHT
jgi:hypothetical protein